MALTRITKGVIKPNENYDTHNINSTGIVTATGLNISGNASIGGVLTYEDVTSIDSVGIITARDGIDCNGDLDVAGVSTFNDNVHLKTNDRLQFGNGNDLEIYHYSNGNSYIKNNDGAFNIQQSGSATGNPLRIYGGTTLELKHFYSNGGQQFALNSVRGAQTEIYYGGAKKFETTNTGINVTGDTDTDTLTTGNATFTGTISAGSTTGTDGYYLKSVGTGVTWAAFPSSRTGLTTTATAGQTTFNFSYNIGFVDVFVNGVKLPSSEFTANNGSTIVLDDAAFANDTLEFISLNTLPVTSSGGGGASNLDGLTDVAVTTPLIGDILQHNGTEFVNDFTVSTTTTSTSQTAISSLPIATYRSVEYIIQATEGTKYHVTKVLAIHDGTNVTFNEFGTLTTSTSLSTFALDINSGNMRLLATPASTNSTVFKVKFTGIKV